MAPHALVLAALHALARHGKRTTGSALAAVKVLDRRGLVRPCGAEVRLTLAGLAVAASLEARRARRGQVLVLPLRAEAGTFRCAA